MQKSIVKHQLTKEILQQTRHSGSCGVLVGGVSMVMVFGSSSHRVTQDPDPSGSTTQPGKGPALKPEAPLTCTGVPHIPQAPLHTHTHEA